MRKIGIYETQTHHTFLYSLILLCKDPEHEIHLFSNHKLVELVEKIDNKVLEDVKVHINEKKTKFKFNRWVSKFSENLDVLIANSLIGGRMALTSYIYLKPKCRFVLIDALYGDTFHHEYKKFRWDLMSNYFAYKITSKTIKRADVLIYHSEKMVKMIKRYTCQPVYYLPNSFNLKEFDKKDFNDNRVVFTIPGSIQKKRKDFSAFFEAVELLFSENIKYNESVKFIILGTIWEYDKEYGLEIFNKIEDINRKYNNPIEYFKEDFIDESIYRKKIFETDILLNAIDLSYYLYGGVTSGLTESIAYGIPSIYPSGYEILSELNSSTLFYSNSFELKNKILSFIKDRSILEELKDKAKQNSGKLSINEYKGYFQDVLFHLRTEM